MGCDGGTIPKRDELVRVKKKPEQKDKTSDLSFRWKHCALTQQPLQQPIVACEMGRLYSKESVLEALLDKSEAENAIKEVAPHIKSLRDVKEVSLTENASFTESVRGEIGDGYIDVQKAKWMCPISSMEMNGRFRFCFLWTCGCVFSEKALKEMIKMKEEGNECLKCQKVFKVLDIIMLNPSESHDITTLKEKIELRRILAKEAKEAKKAGKKRSAASASATSDSTPSSDESKGSSSVEGKNDKVDQSSEEPSSSSKSTSKKPKIVSAPKPPTAAGTSAGTSEYSVAKDPKASEVYKSLFTTHRNAETQGRAHWVTYNPFYN